MRKWTYRISMLIMIVAIAAAALYWIWFRTNPETMTGPWTDPDYPTGTGWLLYPNGGEIVSGIITIEWDTSKTPKLGPDDKIWIGWTQSPRYGNWDFRFEDQEGCFCQEYETLTDSAPNTGTYQWDTTQVLEECNGEHYPYYIKLVGDQGYMDASNTFFNITG